MKLYIYRHCPYCLRVLTYLGITKQQIETIVMASDDYDTPMAMVGQKIAPILQYTADEYMPESMEIIEFLQQQTEYKILEPQNSEIIEWISVTLPIVYRLAMPRWVKMPFEEFQTSEARNYFIEKKTHRIGPFQQALELTDYYSSKFIDKLRLIEPLLGAKFIHDEFSKDDIYLFSVLHGITAVKGLKIPTNSQNYLQFMSAKSNIPLLYDHAI